MLAYSRFAFSGGSNVTLEGSQASNWGWVNANGQKVGGKSLIADPRVFIKIFQWWDAMQKVSSRVNRPHGWGFNGIKKGEIKNMKLWQVRVGVVRFYIGH